MSTRSANANIFRNARYTQFTQGVGLGECLSTRLWDAHSIAKPNEIISLLKGKEETGGLEAPLDACQPILG